MAATRNQSFAPYGKDPPTNLALPSRGLKMMIINHGQHCWLLLRLLSVLMLLSFAITLPDACVRSVVLPVACQRSLNLLHLSSKTGLRSPHEKLRRTSAAVFTLILANHFNGEASLLACPAQMPIQHGAELLARQPSPVDPRQELTELLHIHRSVFKSAHQEAELRQCLRGEATEKQNIIAAILAFKWGSEPPLC